VYKTTKTSIDKQRGNNLSKNPEEKIQFSEKRRRKTRPKEISKKVVQKTSIHKAKSNLNSSNEEKSLSNRN